MDVIAIIPARLNSSRFVGKPLAMIGGKPMIQLVYEQAAKAVSRVYVATNDNLIAQTVTNFGGKVIRTSKEHDNGTSRCAEALAIIRSHGKRPRLVLNVQCDEPDIQPEQLTQLVAVFSDPTVSVATLIFQTIDPFELADTDTVKVVINTRGDAMYFSRGTIPWGAKVCYKHIGIYGFRPQALEYVAALPPSRYEEDERLEQLRWMEEGLAVRTVLTDIDTVAINSPDQI